MQNLVIMNLAVWNGCWIGGHHFLWWQNTFFFSVKLISIFFTARGMMEFSYWIRSLLTLVITHKSIFLLHRYLVYSVPNTFCGVNVSIKGPYIMSYIDTALFHLKASRLHYRMLWALLLAATYCGGSIWPGIVLLWLHKYCGNFDQLLNW